MGADRQRVEAVLAGATAFGETRARAAYLIETCAGDEELRREVESLLAAHDEAGTFLQRPAPGAPLGVPPSGDATSPSAEDGTPGAPAPLAEQPGDRIGRYKLLEKIGEGGMGSVWMAEQEEPVRRRVALKVIKLGMDTREVVARFEAERQALALMDHPNIAKVFDGGATSVAANWRSPQTPSPVRAETFRPPQTGAPSEPAADTSPPLQEIPAGRPYFVMELVRGIRITDYCDQHRLSTAQRLEMFGQVCGAVQHAHQKGIIHRDLKPSNILVTEQEARPVVKVIDFGIAKATDQQLTDKTVFTRFMQFMGTPAYMSPEQAELSSRDIDTRSDIYSLGVLLYELLTGRTPFDSKELLAAGLDEMRRVIREQEPPRPSTRLTELVAADVRRLKISSSQPSTINPQPDSDRASSRRLLQEKKELIRAIRGDLDWIVMKCLEKDRTRRYETANALAMDVQRYLSDEAVVARPPSNLYRFQKFTRRNKLAFVAAAAVVISLVAGLGISTWSFLREREARRRAVAAEGLAGRRLAEVQKANTEAQMALADTRAAKAETEKALAQSEQARRISEAFGQFMVETLRSPDPAKAGRETKVADVLDEAVRKLEEEFTGSPRIKGQLLNALGETYRGLGLSTNAIAVHEKALALWQGLLGPEDPETLETMNTLAADYGSAGRLADAVELFKKTIELQKAKLGAAHPDTLRTMGNLGGAYLEAGQLAESLEILENTLKLQQDKPVIGDKATLSTMNSLAGAYKQAGRLAEAAKLAEQALDLSKQWLGTDTTVTQRIMATLGVIYKAQGRLAKAVSLDEETFKIKKARLGLDHPSTLLTMINLAAAYSRAGRTAEAMKLNQQIFDLSKAKLGFDHRYTLVSMHNLAQNYWDAGRLPEAVSLFEQTLTLQRTNLSPDHPETLTTLGNLAALHRNAGNLAEALPLYAEKFRLTKDKSGWNHADTIESADILAGVYLEAQRFAEAELLWRELLDARRKKIPADELACAQTTSSIAACLLWQGKNAEAESLLRDCLLILMNQMPERTPTFYSQSLLGWALLGRKKYADAEPLLAQGYEGLRRRDAERPSRSHARWLKEAGERLVQLYEAWGKPDMAAEWREKLR